MKLGFSLSPGGLLLPYHAGVLASLDYSGVLSSNDNGSNTLSSVPLAGSSAGSIAVVAHSCGVSPEQVLEATIRVSDTCESMGGARGRLLPLLRAEMEELIDEEAFARLQEQEGSVGVAYRELFPINRSVLQTSFADRQDMMSAVCHSCTFPFFATNWPVAIDIANDGILPRVLVDGFFSVPRSRFGCPDFDDMKDTIVDRTITVSAFPQAQVGLKASSPQDCISPSPETTELSELYEMATKPSSSEALARIYENGWADAEAWIRREQQDDENDRTPTSTS